MPAPKLLLLCEFATLNGGEQSLLATLPAVLAAGFKVAVALPESGPLVDRLQALEITCLPFSLFEKTGVRLKLKHARERLAALLTSHQPDLLHANSLAMGRLSGPVVHKLKHRSLAHLRDILNLRQQVIRDLNFHQHLLAVSQATLNYHVANGLDAAKTQVLYNGVDLEQFRPRPATGYLHQDLSIPQTAPLIGMIGQIGLRKDPVTFLQAARQVSQRHPEAHYLIVGERHSKKQESCELEEQLHGLAQSPELKNRVHFLGVREDVPSLLSELTLLVHPAWQEPLGRVLLEGAASGVAIIASEVGGTPEIFPSSPSCARLFPPGDFLALSHHMSELLEDDPQRKVLQFQARRRAEEMFDIRHRAQDLIRVYQNTLARRTAD